MADTIREKIIQDIVASINGSAFTVLDGCTVYRGVTRFQDEIDVLPVISVVPRDEEADAIHGQVLANMPVDVWALAAIGDNNPSVLAEAVHGELIKAVFRAPSTDMDGMGYVGGGIQQYPDELGQPLVSVSITVVVEYFADVGDPYNSTK